MFGAAEKSARRESGVDFRDLWIRLVVALVLLLPCVCRTAAQESDAREGVIKRLVERIAGISGLRGPLRLEWQGDPRWSEGENENWEDAIRGELEDRSLTLSREASATPLVIHAEETPTQVVLTAAARIGERQEVRIVSVARTLLPPATAPVAAIRLERQMIFESPDRILDAVSLGAGDEGGLGVLLYENFEIVALRVDPKGAEQERVSLAAANLPPTRDPRAEIYSKNGGVFVKVPGKLCEFAWSGPGDSHCRAQKPAAPGKREWRSETVLGSPCDGGDWKVAAGGKTTSPSELQLVPEGEFAGAGSVVTSDFPGPILSVNGDESLNGALAVVRNLRTGNYEIYKITLACGD